MFWIHTYVHVNDIAVNQELSQMFHHLITLLNFCENFHSAHVIQLGIHACRISEIIPYVAVLYLQGLKSADSKLPCTTVRLLSYISVHVKS